VRRQFESLKKVYDKSVARQIPQDAGNGGWGAVVAGIKRQNEDQDWVKLDRLKEMIELLEAAEKGIADLAFPELE
jgi:hypothetical protein